MSVLVCKFDLKGQSLVGTVLQNKGIGFQVKLDNGVTLFVPNKRIIAKWEEPEDQVQEFQANPEPNLPSQEEVPTEEEAVAEAVAEPEPKARKARAKKAKAESTGPRTTVALKELCFELGLEPRIARRRLRKALGNVGTGQRWEWEKDSLELVKVLAALTATSPEDDENDERVNRDAEQGV